MNDNQFANRIKETLEEETGDSYVLKFEPELVNKDGTLWYLHLPLEGPSNGWIDDVYEKDLMIMLRTPFLFDTRRRIEYAYPKMRGRKRLKRAFSDFHRKDVREEFAKAVPAIVAFFDELDLIVEDVSRKYSTSIEIVNDSGAICAQVGLPIAEAKGEKLRYTIAAIKEFDSRIAEWLEKEYPRIAN